ncbi:uncharacterized protein LOC126674120 [Mercurialis annua]|uniref:uncharacterized protein LOC126674120 n=1 Tax=Mercurialis annua TaxID=3986 RepID=UPI002160F348|nr:uncharacterized protein LOC126674120 [Mercurialis annua]
MGRSPQFSGLEAMRLALDELRYSDIDWQPYSELIISQLPSYCFEGSHFWRARVPLIYFHIIEWHQPDRVLQRRRNGIPTNHSDGQVLQVSVSVSPVGLSSCNQGRSARFGRACLIFDILCCLMIDVCIGCLCQVLDLS